MSTDREFPSRPIVGVGAIVVTDDGRVVLVKRRNAPLAGHWSLPGGAVEVGETLHHAVVREVREETGLTVHVGPLVDVVDRIHRDDRGRVEYHYVLADYLCRPHTLDLRAGADAEDVALIDPLELSGYGVEERAQTVIRYAFSMWTAGRKSQ